MSSYDAIGAALAARFAIIAAPAGEDELALVTNILPQQLGTGPVLLVWPPLIEDFAWGPSRQRWSTQTWPIRFYRTRGANLPDRLAAMQLWRPLLIDQIAGQIQLGLPYVDWAELTRIELVQADYAQIAYDAFDMTAIVQVREVVTSMSA